MFDAVIVFQNKIAPPEIVGDGVVHLREADRAKASALLCPSSSFSSSSLLLLAHIRSCSICSNNG